MIIRDFRPDEDGPATLDVFIRAIRETASRDYTPEQVAAWIGEPDPEDWTANRAARWTQVAEQDGQVVGFTDVDADGYVDMLFVHPAYGRREVGAALLAWASETATAAGATELTTHGSLTARPFFERHGFRVLEQRWFTRRGVELTNFVMVTDIDGG